MDDNFDIKICSEKYMLRGMSYTAKVEQSNAGCGNSGFPTKITIHVDAGGNYFTVNGEHNVETIEVSTDGEWEASLIGDVFEWVGKELKKIHSELKGVE